MTVTFKRNEYFSPPSFTFPVENPLANSLVFNVDSSLWINDYTYVARFDLLATSRELLTDIDVTISGAQDLDNIAQQVYNAADQFTINTLGPQVVAVTTS